MTVHSDSSSTKKNVEQFNADINEQGSYQYTANRLSCKIVNKRISECIASVYSFSNARVLDIGCGDGTYTVEFAALGAKEIIGMDPANDAVAAANKRAKSMGVDTIVTFQNGNIYQLEEKFEKEHYDCIVLRGVLHHLPDPEKAMLQLKKFKGSIIILEPNGYNPVLKLLEKFSKYHVEHEECSFTARKIKLWLKNAGFQVTTESMFNLVPMFCPDNIAKLLQALGPYIEKIPLFRLITCGQLLVVAENNKRE